MNIACESGDIVSVISANYGRLDRTTCPHLAMSNTSPTYRSNNRRPLSPGKSDFRGEMPGNCRSVVYLNKQTPGYTEDISECGVAQGGGEVTPPAAQPIQEEQDGRGELESGEVEKVDEGEENW